MRGIFTPILIITVGIGWLLTTLGIMPNVNWVWTLALAVAGILSVVVGGLNKISIISGPLLLVASLFSLLRQTGRLDIDHEIPILTIVFGVLLLVARHPSIPLPEWVSDATKQKH